MGAGTSYVVEVALTRLDEQHLEVVIEVGKSTCDYTTTTATSTHNDVEFLWERRHVVICLFHDILRGVCRKQDEDDETDMVTSGTCAHFILSVDLCRTTHATPRLSLNGSS